MLKVKLEASDDLNPQETAEWVEALDEIIDEVGPDRASYLLERLMERAANLGVQVPLRWNTPYMNSIPPEEEVAYPGNRAIERRIKSLIRWNAMAMVVHANKYDSGHWRTPGDVRFAGYAAGSGAQPFLPRVVTERARQPGTWFISRATLRRVLYARAFLEGRLTEQHLQNFRHELRDHPGCRLIRIRG